MVYLTQAEQQKFIEDIKSGKIKPIDPYPALNNYSINPYPTGLETGPAIVTILTPTPTQTTAPPTTQTTAPPPTTTAPPINSAPPPSAPTNSAPIVSEQTYTYTYPNQSGYTDTYRSRKVGNSSKYVTVSDQYESPEDNSNTYYLYIIGSLVISYFLFNHKSLSNDNINNVRQLSSIRKFPII